MANWDDKQKETHSIEFPLEEGEWISCDMVFIKNGFVYCAIADVEKKQTNIYKIKLGTFDELFLIGSLNSHTHAWLASTSVNGDFYVTSSVCGKMFIVDQSDNVEWKDIPNVRIIMGYGNKLYWAGDAYFNSGCYQEYIIQ